LVCRPGPNHLMQSQKGFEDDLTISMAQAREMKDSQPHSVPSDAWPMKNRQSRGIHHPNTSLLQVHPHTAVSVSTLKDPAGHTLGLGGAFFGLQASFTTLSIFWLDILRSGYCLPQFGIFNHRISARKGLLLMRYSWPLFRFGFEVWL